jgi:hypothetical protein
MKIMTSEDIKILMNYLGETYHNYKLTGENGHTGLSECSCGNKGLIVRETCTNENRSFDNEIDMHLLFETLCKRWQWDTFWHYASYNYPDHNDRKQLSHFFSWLMKPTNFCEQVVNFLKKEKTWNWS